MSAPQVTPRWKVPVKRPKRPFKTALWHRSRTWTASRSGGLCEARIADVCDGRGTDAHHMLRRAQGGSDDPENLMWLCRSCHGWIHANPAMSYERGWLRRG